MATGGEIKAGEAFIELTLKGARNFGQRLRGALRSMGRLAATAARLGAALATAFGAASLAGIRKFVQLGDQMQKMSLRTGASAEALSELGFAAEQSGSSIETVERGFRGMARAIRGLERGLSTQVEAFEALGLTLSDLQDLEPDKQLELIADRLSKMENPTRRAAVAMEVFGRAGTELLPLFQGGQEGIRLLRQQADILGRTVSKEQADRAAALADRWNEVKSVFRGFLFDMVDNFAPALEHMLVQMRNFTLDWKVWVADLQVAFEETMVGIGISLEDTLNTFGLGLAGTPLYDPNLGTNFLGGSRAALNRARGNRAKLSRPSEQFELVSRSLEEASSMIGQSVADAIEKTEKTSGRSFGSFTADARQFGIVSVGRKQLRALERIENIQQETLRQLETKGFFGFL